ncbi:MAG: lipopolysaccharide/colanic/teichoic acid biosynthesis glycosyltransferase [Candidatus Paceibacteria bacterium]
MDNIDNIKRYMTIVNKKEPVILLLGDIAFFYVSLWVMLLVRYAEIPSREIYTLHAIPFSIVFLVWIVIFFIAGLYERHTSMMRQVLSNTIFQTQVINSMVAVLFFYFIPFFVITPKTNLFIYLLSSFVLLVIWRLVLYPFVAPKAKQNILLIARGEEMKELREEINSSNFGYKVLHSIDLDDVETIDVQEDIVNQFYAHNANTIIIDTKDDKVIPLLPHLYNLMFSNITFIDMHDVYEYVFTKVPLSLVKHGWFLENVRSKPHIMYDALKRLLDIFIAGILAIFSLVVYPFVWLGIKFDDGGSLFYVDKRVGIGNHAIEILKFRSMKDGRESKVGSFIRKTRIDELPQLWSVIKGDLSLIGPRPEKPELVEIYKKSIPFYGVRLLLKPGLSGWAQMKQENHPHHDADIEATCEKLSYDLFYIKNRSFLLDLKIALQTIKTLVSMKGK